MLADLDPEVELDARELLLLEDAARQRDVVVELERAIRRDGVTVSGSRGQVRPHRALQELRRSRLAVAQLLQRIEMQPPQVDAPGVR